MQLEKKNYLLSYAVNFHSFAIYDKPNSHIDIFPA